MNKSIFNIALSLCAAAAILTACEDQSEEVTEISYGRLFGASAVKTVVMNQTSVRLTWTQVGDVDYYDVQIGTDSAEIESNLVLETTLTSSPTLLEGFDGDTQYYGRMQSIKEGETSSYWVWFSFKTGTEQKAITAETTDVQANEFTARWEAGIEANTIVLTETSTGEVVEEHTLTDEELEEGVYTFYNLTGSTSYKAVLYKGSAVRASWSITTLIDLGDAFGVYEGDDLAALIDSVDEDGNYLADEFYIIDQADFVVGSWTISRSVTIHGYNPAARPTIHGAVWNGNTDSSIELVFTDIIFDGAQYAYTSAEGEAKTMSSEGQVFVAKTTGSLSLVSFEGCLIKNYTKGILYDNVGATIDEIVMNDCVCDSINSDGTGGGGSFDFRAGTLGALTISNSTFMNGSRDFTRIASSATNTTFSDCTFFRIGQLDGSSNTGFIRQASGTFTMTNCIVDQFGTADGETYSSYGYWTKSASNYGAEFSYSEVYYSKSDNLWTGYLTTAPDGVSELSTGVGVSEDGFSLTSDGYIDITLQSEDYIGVYVGDPRWYYPN